MDNYIDDFFPIKSQDGKPSYRKHQKETIEAALKAFNSGKRFIAIDGPVGSGKSVINYTISRCVGPTVYLTPQKQLQDQIMEEGWKSVRMVKGKATYLCNYCSTDGKKIPCDYKGDSPLMCNNSKAGYKKKNTDEEMIKQNIKGTLFKYFDSSREKRVRTSFEHDDDLNKLFGRIKTYINEADEIGGKSTMHPIQTSIGCTMTPIECSVKSAKMLAKIDNVRILNPDVFYNIVGNSPDYFGPINLLIIDECHTIEDVIQRIFRVKIPLDTIRTIAGIELFELMMCKNIKEFIKVFTKKYRDEIGPYLACANILKNMGDVVRAHSYESMCQIKSGNEYAAKMSMSRSAVKSADQSFSTVHLANIAFSDSYEEWFKHANQYEHFRDFVVHVRQKFTEECKERKCNPCFDLNKSVLPACKEYTRIVHNTENYRDDRPTVTHVIEVSEALEKVIKTVITLIGVGNNSFVFEKRDYPDAKPICKGTKFEFFADKFYGKIKSRERYIEVVPVNVGALLKIFFFNYAGKVLLSTGTWTDLEGMYHTYGIKKEESEYIKIPTTFPPERRKVYILDNSNYTNFSSKSNGVDYDYKTDLGVKKFATEVFRTINFIRDFVNRNTGINPNVIIHTHTFHIARQLARHGTDIDDKFLIHLAINDEPIINENNGFYTYYRHKDELIEVLKKNPDSGLVLASASISEGMDFKYGIARAQIILKRPTPYMGDPYVKAKFYGNKEINLLPDKKFLDRVCLTQMIQQYGRIMRANDDWGFTFILDQAISVDFKELLGRYGMRRLSQLNIEYFKEGIQFVTDKYWRPEFIWPFKSMLHSGKPN